MNSEEAKASVVIAYDLVSPLTRNERGAMNALSEDAFGNKNHWRKLLDKGELKPETITTNRGSSMDIKRLHHFTINEIKVKMETILADREVARAKAAAEKAAKEAADAATVAEKQP